MRNGAGVVPIFDFDAFGAAVASALVCGALSLLVSILVAPTATLVCLAVAGWVSIARRRGHLTRGGLGSAALAALGVLGGSAVGFLAAPSNFAPFRGLLLAGGLVPLWLVERTRSGRPVPVFSSA